MFYQQCENGLTQQCLQGVKYGGQLSDMELERGVGKGLIMKVLNI